VAVPAAPAASNGNGHSNGHSIGASPPPTVLADAGEVASLRRRVRSAEEESATEPAEVVHGPSRAAEQVRDSWSRLAVGVRQAREENRANNEESTP
jgi:hypothetical protein